MPCKLKLEFTSWDLHGRRRKLPSKRCPRPPYMCSGIHVPMPTSTCSHTVINSLFQYEHAPHTTLYVSPIYPSLLPFTHYWESNPGPIHLGKYSAIESPFTSSSTFATIYVSTNCNYLWLSREGITHLFSLPMLPFYTLSPFSHLFLHLYISVPFYPPSFPPFPFLS